MDKETQKEMKKNQELIDHYDYLKNAASSTDCTGLIPALPESEDELDAYNDVYQYQTPLVKPKSEREHTRLLFSNTPTLQSR